MDMKYFVVADVHAYYDKLTAALSSQGFDPANPEHIFVSLGDLLDRGNKPEESLAFVNALPEERKILVRGNHEDLLEECLERGSFLPRDIHNGTAQTIYQLAGTPKGDDVRAWCEVVKGHAALNQYLGSLVEYAQLGRYVLVHGWIPARDTAPSHSWKKGDWKEARWCNGMKEWAQGYRLKGRTIVCGHYHTSWGHCHLDHQGTEFGPDAINAPFAHEGILAIDSCVAHTHVINCVVLEV